MNNHNAVISAALRRYGKPNYLSSGRGHLTPEELKRRKRQAKLGSGKFSGGGGSGGGW